jgi:hypothetical protein
MSVSDATLFSLDGVSATRHSADSERVKAFDRCGQSEVQPDSEVRGMAPRTAPDLADAAAIAQRVLERRPEPVRGETQRVQEVALTRTIWAHQKRESTQSDVTAGHAPVVLEPHAVNDRRHDLIFRSRPRRVNDELIVLTES